MIGASVFPMERQSVYAVKPYWTPIDRDPGKGMTALPSVFKPDISVVCR